MESLALLIILRGRYGASLILRNSLIANTLTHPLVWFAFPLLWPKIGWIAATASAELFAFSAEAAAYALMVRGLGLKRAAAASLLCNALSFASGLALAILFNL